MRLAAPLRSEALLCRCGFGNRVRQVGPDQCEELPGACLLEAASSITGPSWKSASTTRSVSSRNREYPHQIEVVAIGVFEESEEIFGAGGAQDCCGLMRGI
ncbi:MAG: hypothetical protein AB2805_16385 [Candidatus Thiodiazotropha sp.]